MKRKHKKWKSMIYIITVCTIIIISTVPRTIVYASGRTYGTTTGRSDYNTNETIYTDSDGRVQCSNYDLYYDTDNSTGNLTSYVGFGYSTVLQVGSTTRFVGNRNGAWAADTPDRTVEGIYCTTEVQEKTDSAGKGFALVIFTLHNITEYATKANLATSTDLEIGGDDNAIIRSINYKNGFTASNCYMMGVTNPIVMNFYFKNNSYINDVMQGVQVDKQTIYIGTWSDRFYHLWEDSSLYANPTSWHNGVTGQEGYVDTAFNASWQGITVPANSTAKVAYVLSVGTVADKFTIKYNGNGATSGFMSSDIVDYLSEYNIKHNEFKNNGYEFIGWKSNDGIEYVEGEKYSFTVHDNTTLYAQWKDITPPIIDINDMYGWTNCSVKISPSAKDGQSGMKSLVLSDAEHGKGNVLASSEGIIYYTFVDEQQKDYYLLATDNAGNSSEKKFTVKIDKTPPEILVGLDETYEKQLIYENTVDGIDYVSLNISGKDSASGMNSLTFMGSSSNANGMLTEELSIPMKISKSGSITYTVYARDNAGNRSTRELNVNVLSLDASIQNITHGGTTEFLRADKGRLTIKVTGKMENVEIIFPDIFKTEENDPNEVISLNQASIYSLSRYFYVPLTDIPDGEYKVSVKGTKGDLSIMSYPIFTVKGSILYEIKNVIKTYPQSKWK